MYVELLTCAESEVILTLKILLNLIVTYLKILICVVFTHCGPHRLYWML